jgi:hypothetical protein
MSISEAVVHTGLSRRTVQRRVDAWLAGDRSPYALRGRLAAGGRGRPVGREARERRVDRLDAERVRAQLDRELAGDVTAEQYAARAAGELANG